MILGTGGDSRQYLFCVRLFALSLVLALFLPSPPATARTRRPVRRGAAVVPHTRVAVQPIEGAGGPQLRARVARILRGRGFHVVTSLSPVSGTAQYPGLARDNDIAAFVVGGVEEHPRRHSITFLVWNGDGSVTRRWSVAAPPRQLPGAVARGFWPRLGQSLALARPPGGPPLAPARPMRIDAGDEQDEPIVSDDLFRRRRPVRN
jgi:hypothetical protein